MKIYIHEGRSKATKKWCGGIVNRKTLVCQRCNERPPGGDIIKKKEEAPEEDPAPYYPRRGSNVMIYPNTLPHSTTNQK